MQVKQIIHAIDTINSHRILYELEAYRWVSCLPTLRQLHFVFIDKYVACFAQFSDTVNVECLP